MGPIPERLRMYGQPSDADGLEWPWVEGQLESAGTYWVVARGAGHPHPRPVWGVLDGARLCLSIGSPGINRSLREDPLVTVHLDSGTDVVIVEGSAAGTTSDASAVAAYDAKYDWTYDLAQYGPLAVVAISTVLAWRATGPAGRDGFTQTARWRFPATPT